MPRLIKPDGEKIRKLCDGRGWGPAELSKEAGVALATAAKIMDGKECFRKSLMMVAEALDQKTYIDLLEGSQPETTSHQENKYEIHLHLAIGRDALDEDKISTIIELLRKMIRGSGDTDMTNIKDGSTILTLSLSEEDFGKLIEALNDQRAISMSSYLGTIEGNAEQLVRAIKSVYIDEDTLVKFLRTDYAKRRSYNKKWLIDFKSFRLGMGAIPVYIKSIYRINRLELLLLIISVLVFVLCLLLLHGTVADVIVRAVKLFWH